MSTAVAIKSSAGLTLVRPFVESVQTVFRTMLNTEIKVAAPYLKTADQQYDVFGIIGFSGELIGSMAICLTRSAASNIVETFTGSRLDADSVDFADAIGELANMIAGCAKSKLGGNSSITVPSVVIGERCHVAAIRDIPCTVLPCSTALGEFTLKVCVKASSNN